MRVDEPFHFFKGSTERHSGAFELARVELSDSCYRSTRSLVQNALEPKSDRQPQLRRQRVEVLAKPFQIVFNDLAILVGKIGLDARFKLQLVVVSIGTWSSATRRRDRRVL